MNHGCIMPGRLGFDSSYIAHVHITPCLICTELAACRPRTTALHFPQCLQIETYLLNVTLMVPSHVNLNVDYLMRLHI